MWMWSDARRHQIIGIHGSEDIETAKLTAVSTSSGHPCQRQALRANPSLGRLELIS